MVLCLHRLPKSRSSADRSAEGSRGRGRLPQRCCVANFMVRSPEYSPLRPSQSSSEDSSSEHSSSSYISSPGRDGPTEIPKLCPPPYGFHFGAQKKNLTSFTSTRATMEDGPLSPQGPEVETPCLSPPPMANTPSQWRERALSPNRILKPPPPYTRLVRTPSLKEYPNHAIRLLPRELVSEELKSWHQRIQLQKVQPGCMDQQGPMSVTSPHLPSFQQVGADSHQMVMLCIHKPARNFTPVFTGFRQHGSAARSRRDSGPVVRGRGCGNCEPGVSETSTALQRVEQDVCYPALFISVFIMTVDSL